MYIIYMCAEKCMKILQFPPLTTRKTILFEQFKDQFNNQVIG